ncbi:VPLPA-CTERM sorting domain-containing protein [Roseovarius sp. EL26]|uniref:VPLPA-CTERM sorting domain-containing protein n=1 Tax=Roseovarius sp. EL26 TaxID=2126672 RepID=UPI0013C51A13|nr:VPLPA-CTERM sorting domain-containing protein [Roseovarius sp. EL26]
MNKIILAAALTLCTAAPSFAASVFVGSSNGTIGTLDTDTGVLSGAYDAGPGWFDIAVDSSGDVYGTTGSSLYSIDVDNSAQGVLLGGHSALNGLAFDDSDTLFGSGGNRLFTLDTTTGASTVVGNVGSGFSSSGDLAFSASGVLFGTSNGGCSGGGDCLFSIDAVTGVGTYIGDIGFSAVFGLSRIGSTLFGMTASDQLISIDMGTGAGTLIDTYNISGQTYGAAVPASAATIPLPAGGWLLLSGFGALAAARRRRKQS